MLIDEPRCLKPDALLLLIGAMNGDGTNRRIQQGVYEISHFGSSDFLRDYDDMAELSVNSYGVCDSAAQLLAACPELEKSDRRFVVTLTSVKKADQPDWGGWRWHKWGPYIGTQNPQYEYLYDEPDIDEVWVYHIYEARS